MSLPLDLSHEDRFLVGPLIGWDSCPATPATPPAASPTGFSMGVCGSAAGASCDMRARSISADGFTCSAVSGGVLALAQHKTKKRVRNVPPCPGCGTQLKHAQYFVHLKDIQSRGVCRGITAAAGAAAAATADQPAMPASAATTTSSSSSSSSRRRQQSECGTASTRRKGAKGTGAMPFTAAASPAVSVNSMPHLALPLTLPQQQQQPFMWQQHLPLAQPLAQLPQSQPALHAGAADDDDSDLDSWLAEVFADELAELAGVCAAAGVMDPLAPVSAPLAPAAVLAPPPPAAAGNLLAWLMAGEGQHELAFAMEL
ncbi:hypothetical protein HXX76_016186 [Chlamydomonas incerta]|uniref:Uncharacterized protein n=1 Tax=Chlamydomonas incerta TaxID=51695 RepID=A0A835VQL5_CHLIN|nr:hypothetical protein HXX76_016186 [Chlamydomonas incerta]|eukprot:KAG2422233.1 hypothetical protein HXX76_016186 [Chlamydomonas incerta]